VSLAFLNSNLFTQQGVSYWPLFMTVPDVRTRFMPGTKVLVSIGGWGDTAGFSLGARTPESRALFAQNIARMIEATGADGVDVDWEFPGGNGEDYRTIPNEQKAWEIEAYPLLLDAIRAAIGPNKLMTAAVPAKPIDMISFTKTNVPRIMDKVDFLNVMTYDLMNRRDSLTDHHTGIKNSEVGIDAYIAAGAPPERLMLGLAFYVKWFRTEHDACSKNPIGCPAVLMEDPQTGADLGTSGAFSWQDVAPYQYSESFKEALKSGTYDEVGGGYYYWDGKVNVWWTFDTEDAIKRKFPALVARKGLAGVFAWGLGEDGPVFNHLDAMNVGIDEFRRGQMPPHKEEL
jgi:GH18 family chitinase